MKARIPNEYKSQNVNSMLKQAQKMQEEVAVLQAELDLREYTTTAGGGMVECTVNGMHEIKKLTIKPDVVDKDDIEILEDLIMAAVNEAINIAEETSEKEMSAITAGVNLPGMDI